MPEGDTIHRSADALRSVLVGRVVLRFDLPRHPSGIRPSVGTTVVDVSARGKHLLVSFSDGLVLHTHMRMSGSWHLYRPGETWRRSPTNARVVIATEDAVAVCFSAPVVEVLDEAGVARHRILSSRGPDLTAAGAADTATLESVVETAVERLRSSSDTDTEIGVALLDQQIASGIGNVYKSEVCHACAVDPFTPVRRITDDTLRALYRTASTMLAFNLDTVARTTVDTAASPRHGGGLVAVYGRAGRPCRRCSPPPLIRSRRQGEEQRSTYWCPSCQR